ncbi:Serine phosphatase [uncultured Eubacteriales bacterium]|uniref:Serine phosphatase n=1 Tax=uncultured Eubacteriales bacterium TaxID=172733 RepID=A0A212KAX6_9FIRM|nr:Serine phosphatase [uncultured Eubacteriales bacterium]
MSEFCTDIGYISLNKWGEQLCGDHVELVGQGEDDTVLVLADGLGSGVKANILSTLTSKIISTMMANHMSIEDCVATIAATLPVCQVRGVAYSTFTIIRIEGNREAEIIQYDNPHVILLRGGKHFDYPMERETIDGKEIYKTRLELQEDDTFVAMSDGAIHAGVGQKLNFGWDRADIIRFLELMYNSGNTAKTVCAMLTGQCNKLYSGRPGDDTTAAAIRIRRRRPLSLMIGPPSFPGDVDRMMGLFFARPGAHIICGGTTSTLAAEYLGKPLDCGLPVYVDPAIPPTAKIEGVDLVTEGVITFSRVLEYAKDYLGDNGSYTDWSYKKDGASQVARALFESATDICFFVGRAANPAHQNPSLPISFNIKMRLVDEVADCLQKMGKRVETLYF